MVDLRPDRSSSPNSTDSTTAVSALILTFLVPAVLFSAVAGVFIDRLDKRLVLIVTNVLRGAAFVAIFFVGDNLAALYLLNIFVSTVTVFFGPAEAAMIPQVVPREAAALGERHLHPDAERRVRARVRAPRSARREDRRRAGPDRPRRGDVLHRRRPLHHAAELAAGSPSRSRGRPRDDRVGGGQVGLRPVARGPRRTSGATARSAGR